MARMGKEQNRRQRRFLQTVWNFLQKETKRTKIFATAEDKAFVSFVIFCLESSLVLRAPTPPGAPRHPPSHSFGVAGSEAATTFYERFL